MAAYPGRYSDPSTANNQGFIGWSPETDAEAGGYTPTAARPEPGAPSGPTVLYGGNTGAQRRKQRQSPSSPAPNDPNDAA